MELNVNGAVMEVVVGDITAEHGDAIVNAANSSLLGGGGVDGAIHRAGGPAILEACRQLGGCPTGEARITTGGDLPARHVIHTVGPVYRDGASGEAELLESCFRRSLDLAREHGVRTISFPAISCGVYGYPVSEAATIAISTVRSYLEEHDGLDRVRFVLFGPETYDAFRAALERTAP